MQQNAPHLLDINNNVLPAPNELRISFLCGVKYSEDDELDKRNVLKSYLDAMPNHRTILLEKYFKSVKYYSEVGLNNLYDVETMVGCFSDNVFIIHESLSTAAEIGMLTSDRSIAQKTLVIYPNQNSAEEEKISGFINFAYYFGDNPILGEERKLAFDPLIKRSYTSNEKFTIHTSFPDDFHTSTLTKNGVDKFLNSTEEFSISHLTFNSIGFGKPRTNKIDVIDYWQEEGLLQMRIHPMSLRCLLFSLASIDSVRDLIENASKLLDVVSIFEDMLKEVLLLSARERLGEDVAGINIDLKGIVLTTFHQKTSSDLRKAIGLFIFLLEAMEYLDNEKNESFKFTARFKATRELYETNTVIKEDTAFKKTMDETTE